jgi:hypothetical protein
MSRTAKIMNKKSLIWKVEDKLEKWNQEYEDKQFLEFSLQVTSQREEKQPETLSFEVIFPEEITPITLAASQRLKKHYRAGLPICGNLFLSLIGEKAAGTIRMLVSSP